MCRLQTVPMLSMLRPTYVLTHCIAANTLSMPVALLHALPVQPVLPQTL
jgi:hypothetical protein